MNKMIIGNLKTYMNKDDVDTYLKEIENIKVPIVLCPTSIYIPYFLKHNFYIGLQDISPNDEVTCTGDILASQAVSMGISYVIVGHSERRKFETPEDINKKILAANKYNITPILCVGEEKKSRKTKKIIEQYLRKCLKNTLVSKVIIAYEPSWAIGSDTIPSNKEIIDVVTFIREFVKLEYNTDVRVIYGGSVTKENVSNLKLIDNLDGILVGNSSTVPYEFKEIITKYLD